MVLSSRSHWDWVKEMVEQHNLNKPFAPENGNELLFKVGDSVIYTNPAGVEFEFIVTGLYQPYPMTSQYATGKRYLLNWDCPWYPVEENSLQKAPTFDLDRFKGILEEE